MRQDTAATPRGGTSRPAVPSSVLGWAAFVLSAVSSVSWTAVPVLGAFLLGERLSGIGMIGVMVLAVVAALVSVIAFTMGRQRSALNIAALVLSVPGAVIAVAEAVSILGGSAG